MQISLFISTLVHQWSGRTDVRTGTVLIRRSLSTGSAMSHWSVIEHRTRKQDIEVGNYTAQNLENMADLHGES